VGGAEEWSNLPTHNPDFRIPIPHLAFETLPTYGVQSLMYVKQLV